ncbi:hypothetical protein HY969_02820 [Candidatus Kaiserbacteria bacterium]|nr:hypothetical protein [Candidatus Kaiserbacteria bacterium]
MDKAYAQALWKTIQKDMDPKQAVDALRGALEKRGRLSLFRQVGRAFERIAAREMQKKLSVLVIAEKGSEKRARQESGAKDAELMIDETLIGGWRLEDKETLRDASWKSALLSIYNRATT